MARLKAFFAYCERRHLTRADLLADVTLMKVHRRMRQQPTPEILWAMLDHSGDPRDRALLATAMNTGMRAWEIARLTVGHVDLETLTLRVDIKKSLIEDDMPIASDLATELRAWMASYALSIERPLITEDYLFPAATGPLPLARDC